MFNHQYDFKIKIPNHLILPSDKKNLSIKEELIEGKIIIGLCGYSKSGKDSVAKKFVDNHQYKRIAFADNLKTEMNENFVKQVFLDIHKPRKRALEGAYSDIYSPKSNKPFLLSDGRELTLDMVDFFTEDKILKKLLRPYIVWYGEKMRELNGHYYWINKAFEIDAKGFDRIILSDIRRVKELDIFKDSNSKNKREKSLFDFLNLEFKRSGVKSHSSFLFHVNQLGLTDSDRLTMECVRVAQERWLFDDTFYIDPRIPEEGDYRNKAISTDVLKKAIKFGLINKDKTIAVGRQKNLFDN